MSALDRLISRPRRRELDHVDLALTPDEVWKAVRHGPLPQSRLTRALFAIRTLPERLARRDAEALVLRLSDMRSSVEKPGFQILVDDAPHELVVCAIGKVWHLNIPFRHVSDAAAFAAFNEPGWIKVAWALRVTPLGALDSRLDLELRVDATDNDSWTKFRRYFALIGPPSRFIRRSLLAALGRQLGRPHDQETSTALAGDDLLLDPMTQVTRSVTIAATPQQIWPWLVQMGGGRGGFYSIDMLDNGGVPSAREIHPEFQHLEIGQILPATPHGAEGFEVIQIDPERALVLGGLFDLDRKRQLSFSAARPSNYWQVSWAFVLEAISPATTRLRVRARAAYPPSGRLHSRWIRPVHTVMQSVQLRNLSARAEGRLRRHRGLDVIRSLTRTILGLVTRALVKDTSHVPRQAVLRGFGTGSVGDHSVHDLAAARAQPILADASDPCS